MRLTRLIIYMRTFTINMRVKRLLISISLLLWLPLSAYAETHFEELFSINPSVEEDIANTVAQYHASDSALTHSEQLSQLKQLESRLNKIEPHHTNDPVYWFIRGLNHNNMAATYLRLNNDSATLIATKDKDRAYANAIRLDDNRLSAAAYSAMKHGLPEDLKIRATQAELQLGGNGYNDSYYWYLHWSNIDQLKKAGRHSEAQAAYEKMQEELKESDMDIQIYNQLTQNIEKQTFKRQPDSDEKPEKTVSKQIQPPPARQPEEPQKTTLTTGSIIILLAIAAIISLIAVAVYEILLRKRKT